MIPALGILIYNRCDLLVRCLRSVDYPVEDLFIVNNGGVTHLAELVAEEVKRNPNLRQHLVTLPDGNVNLGVAGGWNLLLSHAFDLVLAKSLLICGNDIEWAPGDLHQMADTVADFPAADFVFGNHSYSNFLVKRSGFEKIGFFDENFELAYLEDGDHWQRIIRTPAKTLHAAGLRATHGGSQTIKSDPELAARSAAQHERNWDYYAAKWGCPRWSSGAETFQTPFNAGGPVNDWSLNSARQQRPHLFTYNNVVELYPTEAPE